ncbi:hypothetical protein Scep_025231 [Stephania cephalantha]|uniref:Uncharacterized protein n=1 Tax=Stephania cephalantha TaxID=152367 RepID=A0AAP0HR22_9MAGN
MHRTSKKKETKKRGKNDKRDVGEGERAPKGRWEDMKERREGDGGHGLWWLLLVGGERRVRRGEKENVVTGDVPLKQVARTTTTQEAVDPKMTLKECDDALRSRPINPETYSYLLVFFNRKLTYGYDKCWYIRHSWYIWRDFPELREDLYTRCAV